MKVLLVHNYYRTTSPSGENAVFEAERELLAARDVEVDTYVVHNDDLERDGRLGHLRGALATPWNPVHRRRLRAQIRQAAAAGGPYDVVHIHNTFPRLSPAVFGAAAGTGAAVVYTLHNFRMLCANALFLRGGQACTLCRDRRGVLPALRYACYRGSRAATLPLAAMIALHRRLRTLERRVDAFVALTEFQKAQFVAAGWPAERIHVKPNFRATPPSPPSWERRSRRVVYAGRMSAEKGLDGLIDVWRAWGEEAPELYLLGDGKERPGLEQKVGELRLTHKIRFTGQLPHAETQAILADSALMVFPTRCFEGFPMVVVEAMALGVPTVASRIGSMVDLIEEGRNGRLVPEDNPDTWRRVLQSMWRYPEELGRMGAEARSMFENRYTEDISHSRLMEIYAAAMAHRRRMSISR